MYNVIGMWDIRIRQKSKVKSQKHGVGNVGFTLIEMLITVGVVAVLSASAISLIGPGPARGSRDSRRRADLQSIASALALYRNDNGKFPVSETSLVSTYINPLPTDPSGGGRVYDYQPINSSNTACTGTQRCVRYVLCAAGERVTTADPLCTGVSANCGSTCSIGIAGP